MKKRILSLILFTALALTGCCSSKPNAELDKITEEIIVNPDGTVVEPEATVIPTEAPETEPTAAPDSEEDTSGDNTATDNTSAEEEKYYLVFEATTTDGTAWNSDQLANSKLTMINVWATYCNPCLAEMPDLGELAAEYDAADFQIVGVISDVMADDSAENVDYAKQLIAETKADYPHLCLNESLYMSFVGAVSAVPTTFFVRQDGSVIGYLTGAQSKENWKTLIDRLLEDEGQ